MNSSISNNSNPQPSNGAKNGTNETKPSPSSKMAISFGRPLLGPEEKAAVQQVLEGDILVHGPKATEFESAFAHFTQSPRAISVASCTAGLHLAYFNKKFGPGDEVLVPAQTHVATAHAVELTGAKPVFVDAEINTGNIDFNLLEDSLTEKTKAISIVHYLGMPVDMDKLMSFAKKHKLFVVEDCALAIGSYYKGQHAGTFGDVGCFSFYPVKHMTTTEGGMITTKDENLYATILRQRGFGVDRTASERHIPGVYDVKLLGFNYRMSEVEAAIGIEQLKKVPHFLKVREENYQFLEKGLKQIEEVSLFQSSNGNFKSSYYCLSMLLKGALAGKRFELVKFLNDKGIGTSIYYPQAVPNFTYYKEKYGYKPGMFPIAEKISGTSVALPVAPHLNLEHMAIILNSIKEGITKVKNL